MANKKITVVGDGAEQPLTPEEEHRLEAKVDQMLDPSMPDTQPEATTKAASGSDAPVKVDAPEPSAPPKVTKIITKFADDDEPVPAKTKEESEEPKLEKSKPTAKPKAAPEVPATPAEETKPTSKKITVKHHDEEEPEKPKKSAAKHPKAKSTSKKSTSKLKVTVADGSGPEDLDSKADAITAAALAAEAQLVATKESTKELEEPPVVASSDVPEDLTETTEDLAGGAPPIIQKHTRAPIGLAEDQTPEVDPEPAKPLVSKKISVVHDEDEQTADDTIEVATPTADTDAPAEQAKVTEIPVEEPEEIAEEIDVEVEPEQTAAVAEQTPEPPTAEKKYRPPEGPIQFKRAETPIQPHKPGEPRAQEQLAPELSEDAALAQAFETKPTDSGEAVRGLIGKLLRIVKWALVAAIVAGIVTVAALPSLRNKALGLVGIDTTAHVSSPQQSTTAKPSPNTEAQVQDVYLAKRAGVYNLYRNSLDGQQEQLILAGTGTETSSTVLAPNAANTTVALVSTRDNKKDTAGELQQSLALVSIAGGAPNTIDTADQIKIVDWFGDRIVYVLFNTSTSTADTNRYQLVSYNTAKKTRMVLDHTNYLNDVLSAKGSVYYATAASSAGGAQFVTIMPDGSAKQVILPSEVVAITRTGYDQLILSGVSKWYAYTLGDKQATPTNNVSQHASRLYIDSIDGKKSAYVNSAGSVTVLDVATSKETVLPAANATYPLRWLNSQTLVYRSGDADYALKLDGSQPQKIVDVSDVPGISLWHEQ
jgi:hypothetical protein